MTTNEGNKYAPCSSKSFRDEPSSSKSHTQPSNHNHRPEQPTHSSDHSYDRPSTSRVAPALRRVEWDTLERNWSGYSSSGSSWRVPSNRPPAPTPRAPFVSKKGKGIGKGRRNYERALASGCSSSSSLASSCSASLTSTDTLTAALANLGPEESDSATEPMDLSTKHDPDSSYDVNEDLERLGSKIAVNFEDTVVIEGQPVTFTCILYGYARKFKWYRNGKEIVLDSRVQATIEVNHKIFQLKIKETTRHDHGVYKFEVRNNFTFQTCRAKLFVGIRGSTPICLGPKPRYTLNVPEKLKRVTVYIGDNFELSATFTSRSLENYRWFKNNKALLPDPHHVITCTEYNSTLNVRGSRITDTGIYIVVAKTEHGITSSWSDVQVFDDVSLDELKYHEVDPVIEETPIDTAAFIGEEVRLFSKVRSSFYRSEARWCRVGRSLYFGDRAEAIDYGDGYLGLRIKDVTLDDEGEYAIQLEDKLSGENNIEVCNVTVFSDDSSNEDVSVQKPLYSWIINYGSSVTLDCKFDVSNCNHFFVCWHIGHYKVTHTDSRFMVAVKDGTCILKILQMEPGMIGEARCELLTTLSDGKAIVRAYTTCNLAIVPNSVLLQEMSLKYKEVPTEIMNGKYSKWSDDGLVLTSKTEIDKSGFHVNQSPLPIDCTLFYLEYCRLEDDVFYYLNVDKTFKDDKFLIITVTENQSPACREYDTIVHRNVRIEWDYQGSETASHRPVWYRVDYQMANGLYLPTSVTSAPQLVYNNPMIDESAKFRISTILPDRKAKAANISITHRNDIDGMSEDFIPQPMYMFSRRYQNLPGSLGQGAYGSVHVAKRLATDVDYAVKTVFFKTFEHKETWNREFQLLRSLKHSRIVKMVDAYRDESESKLVMECLWGKELFERIADSYHIVESDMVAYIRQICEGLLYLHGNNVVHLDIKPENIMCVHPNSRMIKLVDFGLARRLNPAYRTMVLHGTKNYVPPEVINFDHLTVKCDMWSLGVLTYFLLSGMTPFAADSWLKETVNINTAGYNYEDNVFRNVSELAKDFIDRLLVVNVRQRMSVQQALEHPWLFSGPGDVPMKNLKSSSATKLRWRIVPPQQQVFLPETPYLRPTIDLIDLPEYSDLEDLRKSPSRHEYTWHTPQPLVGRMKENKSIRAVSPPQTVRSGTRSEALSSRIHSPVQVYQPTQPPMFQEPNTRTYRNTVNERSFAHNLRQPYQRSFSIPMHHYQSALAMYQMQQLAGGGAQNASVQRTPSNPHQLEQLYPNSPMGAERLSYLQHINQQYDGRLQYQRGNIPLMYRPPPNAQCPEVNEFKTVPTIPYTKIPCQLGLIETSPQQCQPANIQLVQSVQHPENPMFQNRGSIYEWDPYWPYCEEVSESDSHSPQIENERLSNITPKLSVGKHPLLQHLESTWQSPEPYSYLAPESAECSNISDHWQHFDELYQQAGIVQLDQSMPIPMPCHLYQPRQPMYQEEESPMASEYNTQSSSPQSHTEDEITDEDIQENPEQFHTEDIQQLQNASRNNLDCRYGYSPELASQSEPTYKRAPTCSIGYKKRQEIQVECEPENQRPETDPQEHHETEMPNEYEYFRLKLEHMQFEIPQHYKFKFGVLAFAKRMRQQTSSPPPNASENLGVQKTEIDPEPVQDDCEFDSSELDKKEDSKLSFNVIENIREREPVSSVMSEMLSKQNATINPERYDIKTFAEENSIKSSFDAFKNSKDRERAHLVQPQAFPHDTIEIYKERHEPNTFVRENEIKPSSGHAGNVRVREQVSSIKPQQTIEINQENEIKSFFDTVGNVGKEVQTSSVPASDIRERVQSTSLRPQTPPNQIIEIDLEQYSGLETSFQQKVIKSASESIHNAPEKEQPSSAKPQSPSKMRSRRPPDPKIVPGCKWQSILRLKGLPPLETLKWLFGPPPSFPPPTPPPEPIDLSPTMELLRPTTSIQQTATSSLAEEITLPPDPSASSNQFLTTLKERPETGTFPTNHPDKRSADSDESDGDFHRKRSR